MSQKLKAEIESEWPLMLRMSKVFADPLRVKILSECHLRAISPRGFFEEFGGVSLDRISLAFDVLAQYDWIREAEPESGKAPADAADRLYRAIDTAIFEEKEVGELPGPMKTLVSGRIFEDITQRVKEALEAGTLEARSDQHFTWTPLALDRRGWETVISRVDAVFYALAQEQADADARMAESGEEPIPMTVALLAFESPKKKDPQG
jgi:hypothetical protein